MPILINFTFKISIFQVAILFAVFAAANATALVGLANTGSSVTSRKQDAHGNYAFGYSVNDGHASRKSQSEVGTGGHKASAYNSHINHVAPVGYAAPAVAVAAPVIARHGLLGAGALGYGAGIAGNGLLGAGIAGNGLLGAGIGYGVAAPVAHAAPVAYSSAINHVAAAPVVAGHGILGRSALGYGAGIAGNGLLGAGHLGYGAGIAGNGLIGAGNLGYGVGIAGHGLH